MKNKSIPIRIFDTPIPTAVERKVRRAVLCAPSRPRRAAECAPYHRWQPARLLLLLGVLCAAGPFGAFAGSPPIVANVIAAQRPATDAHPKWVDIGYTISDPDSTSVNIYVLVSKDSGATWTVPAHTFISPSTIGTNIPVTSTPTLKGITWDAGADWDGHFTANCRVRVLANDAGMVLIPAGSYLRGNPPALGDTDITDAPQYSVYVSAFLMDSTLVTGGQWNQVVEGYASTHGYTFQNAGSFKATSHPVQTVNWLDAVKWCNARSEMENATPVYYTDGTYSTVLKTGPAASTTPFWKPGANGYRLPTEAEWEKAGRGGLSGKRFPWGDTINETLANYWGTNYYTYESGPNGYNATYAIGAQPYTSPVGSFAPNGYYLYDMAGNVQEWCWDFYSQFYYAAGETDPKGPSVNVGAGWRILRGGSWGRSTYGARCAERDKDFPEVPYNDRGFRCVRGL